MGIPFFNTCVLLRRGARVTWRHHSLLSNYNATPGLVMTICLRVCFIGAQGYEYHTARFSMRDGIYGGLFYLATGFHGIHVVCGTLFLVFNLVRLELGHFSPMHHLSYEFAIIYWHFVDVVWLFLYVFVYWYAY